MLLELIRLDKSEFGVFGALLIDGESFCVTLEPEDRDNESFNSCIPMGVYPCLPVNSPTFGETMEVVGVPDRSHILFHAGNTERDTEGCILLGRNWGVLGQDRAILNSGDTFRRFLERVRGTHLVLHITEFRSLGSKK